MKNKAIVMLSFILLLMFSGLVFSAIPQTERAALIALYNNTNGDNWINNSNWKTNGDFSPPGTENNWYGIAISGDHVTEINLSNNNLVGTIPATLGSLSNLTTLYLNSNQLTGIPSQLGNLSELTLLNLHSNQLTEIPPELGNLSKLTTLYLSRNQLTEIPPELGNLSNLAYLFLHVNQLTEIPSQLGNLSKLIHLLLGNNKLDDDGIPSELFDLPNIIELGLAGNKLTSVPPGIGKLSTLQKLKLRGNILIGDILSPIKSLNLTADQSDFRWNALYTTDNDLKTFLNNVQTGGDWESTQTIAPEGVNANAIDSTSIEVSWTPITYTGDTGGYRVFYSTTENGSYTYFGTTDDKTVSRLEVTNLSPTTLYFFKVKTRTEPHGGDNPNLVESEYSDTVSETTREITISGKVTTAAGEGVEGVTLTFSDSGGSTTTDSNGDYSKEVPSGWSGKVTPSAPGYTFDPSSSSYRDVKSDIPEQDYTATAIGGEPVIAGRVFTATDKGVEGVTMYFIDSDNSQPPVVTDSDGVYSKSVPGGWNGRVRPSKVGYDFIPAKRTYENINSNHPNQDYIAASSTPVISGSIKTSAGEGIEEVIMTFSNGVDSTVTDINGNYSQPVPYGWSGEVTPKKNGYTFSPGKHYTDVNSDQPNQDYIATASTPVISGRTETAEGEGVEGVRLIFLDNEGGGSTETTTNSDGNYSWPVPYGWSGKVTPSKTGYTFFPENRDYNDITSDQPNQYYTASEKTPVISGKVEIKEGEGVEDVIMTFSNGVESTVTDINGNYSRPVPYGWSGEINPSKAGYTFFPEIKPYEDVTENLPGEDYTASHIPPVISGRVETAEGEGVDSVILTFFDSEGTESTKTATNSDGNYNQETPYGWSGTCIPSKAGYIFTPETRSYESITGNQPEENYIAAAFQPVVSGIVTTAGDTPVPRVTMTFSGDVENTVTDNSGKYSRTVPYGWTGTVTPSKDGFKFTPSHQNYSGLTTPISRDYELSVPITLEAKRKTEGTLLIKKDYGEISLTIQSTPEVVVSSYEILRKAAGGSYQSLIKIDDSLFENNTYIFKDRYIDKNTNYTYKVNALDNYEKKIGESNEETI